MGRAARRREARIVQGGQVLLLPRLVGRRGHDPRAGQQGSMGGAAQELPSDPQGGSRPSPQLYRRPLRRTEPGRLEEDPGKRYAAAAVLGIHHGRLLQGGQRGLCRDQRQERGFQEALGLGEGVPRRSVLVAAGGRQHLRQLHDDSAAQEAAVIGQGRGPPRLCADVNAGESSMIGYITLGSNDLERARAFYSALLAEIGGREVMRLDNGFTMYGTGRGQPGICITKPHNGKAAVPGNGNMAALVLKERRQVDTLYAKALALGGTDEGAP